MIHRVKKENDMHAGKWNGLGGKLDAGETPEECVIREVREESGLVIMNPRLHGILTFPGFANDEDWYAFLFTALEFEGELIDSAEGVLRWVPDEDLLDLNLWPGDRIFIPWLGQPKFFSGKFKYKEGAFEEYEVVFYGGE
jgi:8-oxo-dGTP diphosphatase